MQHTHTLCTQALTQPQAFAHQSSRFAHHHTFENVVLSIAGEIKVLERKIAALDRDVAFTVYKATSDSVHLTHFLGFI